MILLSATNTPTNLSNKKTNICHISFSIFYQKIEFYSFGTSNIQPSVAMRMAGILT